MRNFNFTKAFCLLAVLFLGGNLSAQQPTRVSPNQTFTNPTAIQVSSGYTGITNLNHIIPAPQFRGTCDTVIFEDFQSQVIPASWRNLDVDGLADANGRDQDWFTNIDLETTTAGDTNYVAAASSWFAPSGVASNWLIMDKFNVCDPALVMKWQSAPFEGPAWMDGYKVLISTTDSATTSFTDTLAVFAEDASGTGGGVPGPGMVHSNFNAGRGVLQDWNASLASYNGMDIWIAFYHDSNDDNLIMVDNIFVGVLPSGDMAMNTGDIAGEYPIVPISQVQTFDFEGRISNQGATPASMAQLSVEVLDGSATSVYTGNSSIASLGAFADTLLTVGTFTPPAVAEDYSVWMVASSSISDPNPVNDSLPFGFSVTDSIYSRDNGVITGALSIGSGSAGFMGSEFDIYTDDTLTRIGFFLNGPTVGDTVQPVVFAMGALGPIGAPIAMGETLIITDGSPSYYEMAVLGGVPMTAGNSYLVALEETAAGGTTLATASSKFTTGGSWVFLNGAWSNSEAFGFDVAFVLRGIFGDPAAVPAALEAQLRDDIVVYPNPASNFINVDVTSGLHSDLSVRFMDLQGRVLSTSTIPANASSLQVYVGDFAAGMYLIEVDGTDGRFVQRVSVK